ncbi:hypothetical protein N374_gp091 [Bacillus phage phiNIT1]|uniref:Uncharacterized protein n=1 Tax=Bacillus phage phiNIT1 TaxID=207656 RepID=S6B1G3_9CAUD|nr:hypothetical protein N374_gp091 [Bacillus phage phiNIT1]BAN59574.1 hypothetical protein [Bacillus phage phiNIT1]
MTHPLKKRYGTQMSGNGKFLKKGMTLTKSLNKLKCLHVKRTLRTSLVSLTA